MSIRARAAGRSDRPVSARRASKTACTVTGATDRPAVIRAGWCGPSTAGASRQDGERLVGVDVHADLGLDGVDQPEVLVDDERHSLDRTQLEPLGDAEVLSDLTVDVRQQRIVEPMLVRELP